MRGGAPVWGTMLVNARDVSAARIYGQLGFDYAIVDSEHAPNGRSELADMGAALLAAGVCPVVRVPHTEPHATIMAVDAGALPSDDGYQSLSLIGSTGATYADDHQNSQLLFKGGVARALRVGEGSAHLAPLVREFAAALGEGRAPSATVSEWDAALAAADAAAQSIASGRAVAAEAR
jgi:predicted dehydrogenase